MSTRDLDWEVGFEFNEDNKIITFFRGNGKGAVPKNGRFPLGTFLGSTGPGLFPPVLEEYVDLTCKPEFDKVPQHLVFKCQEHLCFIWLMWKTSDSGEKRLFWAQNIAHDCFADRMYQITKRNGLMVEVDGAIYASQGVWGSGNWLGSKPIEQRCIIKILQYLEGRILAEELVAT